MKYEGTKTKLATYLKMRMEFFRSNLLG